MCMNQINNNYHEKTLKNRQNIWKEMKESK